ncbi:MAG: hypothetical protein IKJ69_05670 [Clostridia bacterium]|nr:hypothetical protein [Clostridia bacterium]
MNYREKFEEYKKGNLSPDEVTEIENDIEKFTVLMEYFDEKVVSEPIPILPADTDDFSFSEQIDKLINKRIKKSTVRILLIGIMFIAFFFFGLGGTEFFSRSDGVAHFINGIFSAAYYAVNFWLLYNSFTKKNWKPAVFLLVWNVVLIVLTFVFSLIMADAVPFALPIILGFSTLPQYFADIFDSDIVYNVMNVIGTAMIPANLILSVIAIVFSKKSKVFKPILKKKLKVLTTVFFVFSLTLSGVSTAVNYYNGSFPYDFLGTEIARNAIYELDDTFIKSNPLDKSDAALKDILNKLGYEYYPESDTYRKGRSDNRIASISFGEKNNESNRSLSISFAYYCVSPYIRQDKMQSISMGEYFKVGDDETYVMKELCTFGLVPYTVSYIETNGERLTSCKVNVSVKENESYPNGYNDFLEFEFDNGKLTFFDSFAIDELQ